MAASVTGISGDVVVSAVRAEENFGELLDRVEKEGRSLIIEKRGMPRAVLLSLRDYVKLAAPEPEVLRILREEAEQNRSKKLTSRQIDQIINATRAEKKKKKKK